LITIYFERYTIGFFFLKKKYKEKKINQIIHLETMINGSPLFDTLVKKNNNKMIKNKINEPVYRK
jgi:hypothetical protein